MTVSLNTLLLVYLFQVCFALPSLNHVIRLAGFGQWEAVPHLMFAGEFYYLLEQYFFLLGGFGALSWVWRCWLYQMRGKAGK